MSFQRYPQAIMKPGITSRGRLPPPPQASSTDGTLASKGSCCYGLTACQILRVICNSNPVAFIRRPLIWSLPPSLPQETFLLGERGKPEDTFLHSDSIYSVLLCYLTLNLTPSPVPLAPHRMLWSPVWTVAAGGGDWKGEELSLLLR